MGVRDRIAKAVMGIKAYHSSPHDFDKFDLSKIGTGEGAQVYGHGIYAAENPAVSGQGGQYWNQFLPRFSGPEGMAAKTLALSKFDREQAIEKLIKSTDRGGEPRWLDTQIQAMKLLESGAPVGPRTYELNIKADPAQMLDWDKPIAAQSPSVLKTIEDMAAAEKAVLERDITGRELYHSLHDRGQAARTSAALNEAGIPGIKYLDEGSRGRQISNKNALWQEPLTSNYVVFDPSIIDITKKYGVPGAIAAPVMGAIGDQTQYQEPQ